MDKQTIGDRVKLMRERVGWSQRELAEAARKHAPEGRRVTRYLFTRGRVVGEDPLFISDKRGTRLTVSGLDSFFDRLGLRAGIHATPHALRRTCATFCHRSGWSLEAIRRLLGHSDFSVLRRYLDLDTGDIADAHRSAPPSGLL